MKRINMMAVAAILTAVAAFSASACTFYFSYESIEAPVGTTGQVGIRVQKTHGRCTLSSMDEYRIDGEGVQILGVAAWEDLGGGLYETWVQVSLAQEGDGALRISKSCTKEGYEEQLLPIHALAPDDEAAWTAAWGGTYPFEMPEHVDSVVGRVTGEDGILEVGGATLVLPQGASLPDELPQTVRVFYAEDAGESVALLVVGDGLFLRFDHLIG